MKVVIIGGVAGGATAAARIRRLDEQAEILVFERSGFVSYANCGLPYYIGGRIEDEPGSDAADPRKFPAAFQRADTRPPRSDCDSSRQENRHRKGPDKRDRLYRNVRQTSPVARCRTDKTGLCRRGKRQNLYAPHRRGYAENQSVSDDPAGRSRRLWSAAGLSA